MSTTQEEPRPTAVAQESKPTILQDIIDSIFTPGTNSGVIKAMSYSFYGLFLTLFLMLVGTRNIHVFFMLLLSIGLFISIKWFLVQIAEVEEAQRLERLKEESKKTE